MSNPFPFPTERHRDEIPPSSVHPVDYVGNDDPAEDDSNEVAPGKRWLKGDWDGGLPGTREQYIRNGTNDAWVKIAEYPVTAGDHATSHENGGGDEISVTGLSGLLADQQTPLGHNTSHEDGGADPLDVTALDGYPGGGTTFLRDDGTFAAPPGGSGTVDVEDEGSPEGAADTIDFAGAGVSVSFAGGTATVTIPGGSGIDLEEEGTPAGGPFDTIDFEGATVVDDGGGHATVTIPGGGSGVDLEEEGVAVGGPFDTIDFTGNVTVTDDGGGHATVDITGGGGWTQVLNENGTSFANWTGVSGTWSSNGTEIIQTDTSATEHHARITAIQPTAFFVYEADITVVTGAASDSRVGLIVGYSGTLAGSHTGYLKGDTSSGTSVNADQATNFALASTSLATTYTTFYTVRLVVAGRSVALYVNGTQYLATTVVSDYRTIPYVGLYSYQASVKFKNIKLYRPTLPGE